ncbi:MAG TPA: condensation protein, partial [Thermoanaerobaculia bacterium]|nr:condensation protein [Thermoanaerobaculia bacterium]
MSLLTAEKRRLLAQRLKERGIDPGARAEPIPRRAPGLARPSFAQQRLWVLDQLEPGSPFYNIAAAADLLGRLDLGVLARSFGE